MSTARQPAVAPPSLAVSAARFVTIDMASVLTGLSPGAIRTKIARAVWVEDRQYVRRAGSVFVDMKGYEKWVETGQAA